ncbi:MAG: hypothetical protein PHU25_19095 [Deltaproteobacteria bacterium]|nr:hypothetical protein [Deltaproteobacteria bacterium]
MLGTITRNRRACATIAALAVAVVVVGRPAASAADEPRTYMPVRDGLAMGLDPGVALRSMPGAMPVYIRLDLRIGGCLTRWLLLGADWRGDFISTLTPNAPNTIMELGPVIGFFPWKGLFTRIFVHVAALEPFGAAAGGQLGYEFGIDRFTAAGFALGGDYDVRFDGQTGWSAGITLFLSAYDLLERFGRD